MEKQSQLLLQPTEVELGLQVGVEFDKISADIMSNLLFKNPTFLSLGFNQDVHLLWLLKYVSMTTSTMKGALN